MVLLRASTSVAALQRAAPLPLAPCTCALGIRGSKKTPRKYHNKPRKEPSTKPVGWGPGERHPRPKLTVASLLKNVPSLGKAGERVLVNKSNLRNRLVPKGVAAYTRGGQPLRSTPAPFRDWEPFAIREARLQAQRDRQIVTGYPKPAYQCYSLIAENARLSAKLARASRQRRAEAIAVAYKGGKDRKTLNRERAEMQRRRATKQATAATATGVESSSSAAPRATREDA